MHSPGKASFFPLVFCLTELPTLDIKILIAIIIEIFLLGTGNIQ